MKKIFSTFSTILTTIILLSFTTAVNATVIRDIPEIPTHLRIGLTNRASITINNSAIFYGQTLVQSETGFTAQPQGESQIALFSGNEQVATFDQTTAITAANGEFISIHGREYRGTIEFLRQGSGITPVNVLLVDEYLFSVVPSEMPASWHFEALKAQSVAARTYAIYTTIYNNTHNGFDLCDTVHCQVYNGIEWEHPNSTAAVLATSGLLIYFQNQLAETVFFASSGGFTENSENVWVETRPYLRAVPDLYEFDPVFWERTFTLSELTSVLNTRGRNIGMATGIIAGNTSPSGRVDSLIISGTSGQVILEREEIRTFFSVSAGGSLQSRNFGNIPNRDFSHMIASATFEPVTFVQTGETETFEQTQQTQTAQPSQQNYFSETQNIVIFDGFTETETSATGLYAVTADILDTVPNVFSIITNDGIVIFENNANNENIEEPPNVPAEPITPTVPNVPNLPTIPVQPPNIGIFTTGDTITINGAGFGHGVGLSQRGAEGMARQGYTFREILTHFYTNVTIR
ncbi:MAG: SpoIID/LytB domain-containing protein [Firmicutes bacterium]|nr:SpoIID/LytB domain-containing protein [Bacillota bacterium]